MLINDYKITIKFSYTVIPDIEEILREVLDEVKELLEDNFCEITEAGVFLEASREVFIKGSRKNA